MFFCCCVGIHIFYGLIEYTIQVAYVAPTEIQTKKKNAKRANEQTERYKRLGTATCCCACHVSALYNKIFAGYPNHQLTFIRKSTIITNNIYVRCVCVPVCVYCTMYIRQCG